MMTVCTLPFREVWAVDFEYQQDDGEKPIIHCLVALELKTGRLLRIWEDELRTLSCPPYDIGPDSLFGIKAFSNSVTALFKQIPSSDIWIAPGVSKAGKLLLNSRGRS